MPGHAFAITPSDSTDLARPTLKIYVGGVGDLKVNTVSESGVLFQSVPAGTTLDVQATRVLATGTTATKITGIR